MKINLISKLIIFSLIFLSINLFSADGKEAVEKSKYLKSAENFENAFNKLKDTSLEQFKNLSVEEKNALIKPYIFNFNRATMLIETFDRFETEKEKNAKDLEKLNSIYQKAKENDQLKKLGVRAQYGRNGDIFRFSFN